MRSLIAATALSLSVLALSPPVEAQTTQATATAEALFAEGRRLAAEGKYAEACPKFEGAQTVAPTPGTLLNLGDCYEKTKRFASAWASYREAVALGRSTGRNDLADVARKRSTAIEGKLAKLSITVNAPAPGIEITRDGVVVPREA